MPVYDVTAQNVLLDFTYQRYKEEFLSNNKLFKYVKVKDYEPRKTKEK